MLPNIPTLSPTWHLAKHKCQKIFVPWKGKSLDDVYQVEAKSGIAKCTLKWQRRLLSNATKWRKNYSHSPAWHHCCCPNQILSCLPGAFYHKAARWAQLVGQVSTGGETKRRVKKQHGVHLYLLGQRPNHIFTDYSFDCWGVINPVLLCPHYPCFERLSNRQSVYRSLFEPHSEWVPL